MAEKQLAAPFPSTFAGRIGMAQADITPPVGIYARNWGAAAHDVAESVHRPLALRALTLAPAGGGEPLVFIDADLGWWRSLETFRDFQQRLLERLSLEPARFVFALSHTHAAPPLTRADPAWPGKEILELWMAHVWEAAVDVVGRALEGATEGVLDWHTGRCQLAAARDLRDPTSDGRRRICGYDPGTPADDTLLVGRITDRSGRLRATLVHYACHPTTLAWSNRAISPDFIGAMRETIAAATDGAAVYFLQGASGELAPRFQYVDDVRVADRHGRQLAYAALATLEDMEPPATRLVFDRVVESGAPLAVWRHKSFTPSTVSAARQSTVELPLKDWPSADELERQRLACKDRALAERLRRQRDIRRTLGDGETYALPLWCWRLGDAVLVGCMAEAYSQLQIELRRRFPERAVLCLNLINGSIGYLPPAPLYDDDVYQVWQSPFARGCLERTIDAMADLIRQVTDAKPKPE